MSAYQVQADPTAVGGKRIVAAIIDVGIGWVIYATLFFSMAESATGTFLGCSDINSSASGCLVIGDTIYAVQGGDAMLINLVSLAYTLGVFIVMRGLTGRSPGTLLLGLACVNEQGQPLGIGKAFIRSIVGIVDYVPFCVPLVGIITIFTAKGHRRVGDMAAKTFMIDKNAMGQPPAVPGMVTAAAGAAPWGQPQQPGAYPQQAQQPGAYPQQGVADPYAAQPQPAAQPQQAAAGEPQWDEARNAYIQWDAAQNTWLQFDDATQQWTPIQ